MSRPYRILIRRTVEQEVQADDRSTLRLDLDDQVRPEHLQLALERQGWTQSAPGVWEKAQPDGQTMSCDLDAREVTTVIELRETLTEERERELRGDTWNWREMREMTAAELEALRAAAEDQLAGGPSEHKVRGAEQRLREAAAAQLAAGADDRRREAGRVVVEALAASLRDRAAALGTVISAPAGQWQGDDFELTITVRE